MDYDIEMIKRIGIEPWKNKTKCPKRKIKALMKKYATAYYEGKALISDNDFEFLVETLKSIDNKDEYLVTPGWGYKIKNGIKHRYGKVGTLKYYFDYSLMKKEWEDITKIIVTPKLDGMNYVAYYTNGNLDVCLTRGNGYVGKNITSIYTKSYVKLPKELENKTFAINGEVIIKKTSVKESNVDLRDKVAEYINKNKCKSEDTENIMFIPFMILNKELNYSQNIEIINQFENINMPNAYYDKLPTEQELINIYNELKVIYPIDGLVITSEDKSKQIAFKFK